MLEIRLSCENCGKDLPANSEEAMICSFECTFCKSCVSEILKNVCPNCGGGFVERPIRPKALLKKYPPSEKKVFKAIDKLAFEKLLKQYKHIKAAER